MSAGPATATTPPERAPRDPEGARLLALLRTLLTLGRTLLQALQALGQALGPALGPAHPPIGIARRFRCLDLALVIARVRRGLLIAEALEARLLRRRPRLAPPAPRQPVTRAPVCSRPPRRTDDDDEAELRGTLPTADQIAARIRRRAIGAVFVDICRDLGLYTSHPDWREIQKAIVFNGGSMVTMLRHWTRHLPVLADIERLVEAGGSLPALCPAPLSQASVSQAPVSLAPVSLAPLSPSDTTSSAAPPSVARPSSLSPSPVSLASSGMSPRSMPTKPVLGAAESPAASTLTPVAVAAMPRYPSDAPPASAGGRCQATADAMPVRPSATCLAGRMPDLLASTALASAIVPARGAEPSMRPPSRRAEWSDMGRGARASATPPMRPPRSAVLGPLSQASALPP